MADCFFQVMVLFPIGVPQVALGHRKIRIDAKGCLPSFHALGIALLGVEEIAQVIMSFVVAGIVLQCGLQNSDAFQALGKNIVASGLPRQLELLASFCRLSLKVEIETKGVSNER